MRLAATVVSLAMFCVLTHRSMASAIEIRPALNVSAPWLASSVSTTGVHHVDNEPYVKLLKTDAALHRLITGQARGSKNLLTKYAIIDGLIELRNEKRTELLNSLRLQAEDDLGLNEQNNESAAHLLPDTITIAAPAVGDVRPIDIKTLCTSKHSPLVVVMSTEVMQYLRDTFVITCDPDAPQHKRARFSKSVPYFAKDRGSYRVRYVDDGESKVKDFKVDNVESDESMEIARQRAQSFYESLSGS